MSDHYEISIIKSEEQYIDDTIPFDQILKYEGSFYRKLLSQKIKKSNRIKIELTCEVENILNNGIKKKILVENFL